MSPLARLRAGTLRSKFMLPISALLLLVIATISSYLLDSQTRAFRRELETGGRTMAQLLAQSAESGLLLNLTLDLEQALKNLEQFPMVHYAVITNTEGTRLAEVGTWDEKSVFRSRPLEASPDDTHHRGTLDFYVVDKDGTEYIEINQPVVTRTEPLDRERLGMTAGMSSAAVVEEIGSIKLILSLESVNKSIAQAQRTTIFIAVVVIVVAMLVLTFLIRVVTRPIQQLVEATDRIGRGDFSREVDIDRLDEIGQLARTFNGMMNSLKQSRDEIEQYNRTLEEKIIERTHELEETQAQLIQSEKLSAIGQLAAGVAHELNNPLGGILGYAQFALEKMRKDQGTGIAGEHAEAYIRYLTDIETQARRCKTIVQNLLRFSRSSRTMEFDLIDINQVIEDTCTFVEHQLTMKQITLAVDMTPHLPPIQGNPGQLQQVFTNLIINAMHASHPESRITVVSRFSPAVGEFGGAIEIACVDEGEGIPPENLKKIFEPFFTTKEVGKGTGLGLSVSYGIIKEHGGEIQISSKVGQGSTFTVILPVQKAVVTSDTV